MQSDKKPPKKKPGRPRKKPVVAPFEIHGVVQAPLDKKNVVEMMYHNPIMFRKLISLLKSLSVNEVYLKFSKDKIIIVTMDHFKKSLVVAEINGFKLNHYFCEKEIEIGVRREVLEKIFHTVDKVYNRVVLKLKKDSHRSVLFIELYYYDLDKMDQYEVELINLQNKITKIEENILEYPIRFEFTSKYFKKIINDMSSMADSFSIEKIGLGPLQITYQTPKYVNLNSVYRDGTKIKLFSAVKEDDIFAVSVKLENVKPFACANVGDTVEIFADKYKKMLFMSKMDKDTCIVKIYTEIIDNTVRSDQPKI
jgi:hypothetical protein